MMLKLRGCGLPNVWLINGFRMKVDGDSRVVSYSDIAGLFNSIARSIALTTGDMSCEELRFLRKRLEWTQQQLATIVGKVDQTVAKWEKGQADVPRADANLIRLAWLERHSRRDLAKAVKHMTSVHGGIPCHTYVFHFDGKQWMQDEAASTLVAHVQAQHQTQDLVRALTLEKHVTPIESRGAPQVIKLTQPQGTPNEYHFSIY